MTADTRMLIAFGIAAVLFLVSWWLFNREEKKQKRNPGQRTEGEELLVLSESTKESSGVYTHQCGTVVLYRLVHFIPIDPLGKEQTEYIYFCPKCEFEPTGRGSIERGGALVVYPT